MRYFFAACSAENSSETGSENAIPPSSETFAAEPTDEPVIPPQPESTNHFANILVAYFSCMGNTKQLAECVAAELNADLYEIVPEIPYTDADLDYRDSNSRSSTEMSDNTARPAISGSVERMEDYDIVFLAYPIWFGEAPRIISTFVESYDFSGKTIVPLCTSGSSGIGSSDTNLHKLCAESVIWMPGERFAGGTSKETVADWLNSLELDNNE